MSQVTTAKTIPSVALPKAISNLDLMKLIYKINSQMDKFSSSLGEFKKDQISIFVNQASSQKKLKIAEGASVLSLALLSGVAGASSHFAQGFLQTALKTSAQVMPFISQGTQSIFSSYDQLIASKKYIAQSESESSKTTDEKLSRQVTSNNDSLFQLIRQLGSLNHLR